MLVDSDVAQAPPPGAVRMLELGAHRIGLFCLEGRFHPLAYLPEGAGVEFDHRPLADGEVVHVGNTEFQPSPRPAMLRHTTRTS